MQEKELCSTNYVETTKFGVHNQLQVNVFQQKKKTCKYCFVHDKYDNIWEQISRNGHIQIGAINSPVFWKCRAREAFIRNNTVYNI